jgi:hypothetical protein
MTMVLAAAVAVLSLVVAVAHSSIGERRIFRPLAGETQTGALRDPFARPILRAVWHLPSVAWALLGVGVLVARLNGGDVLVSALAATLFGVSGVANVTALKRPFIGGLLLMGMAGLVVADVLVSG